MKRLFDLIFVLFAVCILFFPLFLIAFLVRLWIGNPILFVQERPGRHGIPFKMIKFRTMTQEADENGCLLPDAKRLTQFGRFLRSTSIDELPELWNVLRGEMSIVGPRPLLMDYLPLYSKEQAVRHEVRPGITGWAQINGRNAISWEEKFALDVWYVNNRSIYLDMKIIFLTLLKVIRREGISASDEVTMPKFKGSGSLD